MYYFIETKSVHVQDVSFLNPERLSLPWMPNGCGKLPNPKLMTSFPPKNLRQPEEVLDRRLDPRSYLLLIELNPEINHRKRKFPSCFNRKLFWTWHWLQQCHGLEQMPLVKDGLDSWTNVLTQRWSGANAFGQRYMYSDQAASGQI